MQGERVLYGADIRRIENLQSGALFDELVDFTAEVCFNKPIVLNGDLDSHTLPSTEVAVINHLGTRGLRAAIEVKDGLEWRSGEPQNDATGEKTLRLDDPFREASLFSDQQSPEVIQKAKQFGEAMLREAFGLLGPDAYEQCEKFKKSTSIEDQIEVIAWLQKRLEELTKGGDVTGEDGDVRYYNPLRLSPKFVGRYPNNRLPLTCLSVSIAAASFFERAGAEHMYAGMMRSRYNEAMMHTVGLLGSIGTHLQDRYQISMPETVLASIDANTKNLIDNLHHNDGYHAFNFVKMNNGWWCHFDANFDQITFIDKGPESDEVEEKYSLLNEFNLIAPNLELTVDLRGQSVPGLIIEWLSYQNPNLLPDENELKEFFLSDDDESLCQRFKEKFILPFFTNPPDGKPELAEIILEFSKTHSFNDACDMMFDKYVLWEESIEAVKRRCRQDKEYLERRINDARALPLLVGGSSAMFAVDNMLGVYPVHSVFEVGMPAQRIGMAVLSEFAANFDDRLPASFWFTHWPSSIPVTEHMNGASRSSAQDSVTYNNAVWARGVNLQYVKSYDTVSEFLSLREPRRRDDRPPVGSSDAGDSDGASRNR